MLETFLAGAVCMGFFTIALYFLRFWRQTRDRLFLYFAAAFSLLVVERVIRAVFSIQSEWVPSVYLIRLCAFILILVAIADKNRRD